jgi:hypothetical protein
MGIATKRVAAAAQIRSRNAVRARALPSMTFAPPTAAKQTKPPREKVDNNPAAAKQTRNTFAMTESGASIDRHISSTQKLAD